MIPVGGNEGAANVGEVDPGCGGYVCEGSGRLAGGVEEDAIALASTIRPATPQHVTEGFVGPFQLLCLFLIGVGK